jgi:acetyl esterase/lipase
MLLCDPFRSPPPARLRACLAGVGFFLLAGCCHASPASTDWRDWETAKIRLHVARAAALRRLYYEGPALSAAVASEQAEVRRSLDRLACTAQPPRLEGLLIEAYLSEIDDSPQPFWRYVPRSSVAPTSPPPLLVVLHGYNPFVTLADAPCIPLVMTNLAERIGALIAAPFGRGNTDYQHIGEQDVLRVIDEMRLRHGADTNRVVLSGISMGGLGVWCIGARWADRFNALLPICGRGDFYVWHGLGPGDLPGWHRELVDTQFATRYLDRLLHTPILSTHGRYDDLVSWEQGRFPPAELVRMGATNTRFITFTYAGHDVFGATWAHPLVQAFLETNLGCANPKPPPRPRMRPGATGSRLQDAFLTPFLMVGGDDGGTGSGWTNLLARAQEWERFAFARPPMALEADLDITQAAHRNLFVFGEPETSRLVRRILEDGGVAVAPDQFTLAGRAFPRQNHGLWFTGRNPFNPKLTAVVQCGIPWGERLPDNHRYDRIPDVIAYTAEVDRWGSNVALAAGFLTAEGRVRWSDPPFTEAIRRPPDPPPWPDEDALTLPY